MRLQRVVIGMDFGVSATAAAAWTVHHFAPNAELVLVHAITVPEVPRFLRARTPPTEMLIETARLGADQRMRELAMSLGAQRIWPEIRVGPAAEQIGEACSEYDADLIVVGPHGERPGSWGEQLGSTAEQLVRIAPVPVLVATNVGNARPQRILVSVNDSDVAPWVVRWARGLAEHFDAQATAMYVLGPAVFSSVVSSAAAMASGAVWPAQEPARTQVYEDADQWLTRAVNADAQDSRIATEVVFGDPGDEIVAAATRMNADLIVMGSRGLKGLSRLVLGSVASHVLRHAPCPTLVVKEPEDELVSEVTPA